MELKTDKDGLKYLNYLPNDSKELFIDNRTFNYDHHFDSKFYTIPNEQEYIIKHSCLSYSYVQLKKIKEMLLRLTIKQPNVLKTDFPIGYIVDEEDNYYGQIIKYYPDGISLSDALLKADLIGLFEYYMMDDDGIHNMFMLFLDVLDCLEEMVDNGVYFSDVNNGNIILYNNIVKIIDFDYRYVSFDRKNKTRDFAIGEILLNYNLSLSEAIRRLCFQNYNIFSTISCFNEEKEYVKKLENQVRRK